MKKLLAVLLIILISLMIIGCKADTKGGQRQEVTINMPKDDTVNGYRTESVIGNIGDTVSANKVAVESNKATSSSKTQKPSSNVLIQYCANTNSKTFHKSECGSAKNLNEENKYITSNRQELVEDGYAPCKKCNP